MWEPFRYELQTPAEVGSDCSQESASQQAPESKVGLQLVGYIFLTVSHSPGITHSPGILRILKRSNFKWYDMNPTAVDRFWEMYI